MIINSQSVEETIEAGRQLARRLNADTAVLLTGEPGSGKTRFVKGIAQGLGVTATVTSPTFALVNEYQGDKRLYHFDLYRIDNLDDLYAIGFFDYIGKGVIAIEWSENVPKLREEFGEAVEVGIEQSGENERIIRINGEY